MNCRVLFACVVAVAHVSAQEPAPAARRLPNVLVLYADDLGYGDLGCYAAESKIPTPHLDRLAAEGLRCTDAHSSSGICTPSRYALLTGQHHWRRFHEIVDSFGPSVFRPGQLTMAAMLRRSGYETACIGKWHLGWDWTALRRPGAEPTPKLGYAAEAFDWTRAIPDGPLAHGFDHYFGDDVPNFPPYAWIEDERVVVAPSVPYAPTPAPAEGHHEGRPGPMVAGWRLDAVMPELTRRAVHWLGERGDRSQPWFLYLPFTAPHAPIVPAAEFTGRSEAGPYGDYVAQVDAAVGDVLAQLDATGQRDDTIVVFSSDNGPERYAYPRLQRLGHDSTGGRRGVKRDVWEGGHRVPLLVRWPGVITPGRVSDALVGQVDLMATLASIVGFDLPGDAAEDSFDQSALWRGERETTREFLVHNTYASKWAIRRGRWLLIDAADGTHNPVPPELAARYEPNPLDVVLCDLVADPGQRENLAAQHPEVVAELRALLRDVRERGHSAPRLAVAPDPVSPQRSPNVLLLFADDLRVDALGAFGGVDVHTPNLDALARRGTMLTEVHCMGSRHGAVCAPSRAMLLSGRLLPRAPDDLAGCRTLPEWLRERGYATFAAGKWHNGDAALVRAFPDARCVFRGGMCDHHAVPLCDVEAGEIVRVRAGERHSSELFADAAIEFLRRHRAAGAQQPFFVYVPFTAPHDPRDPPPRWLEALRDLPAPRLPANFRGQHGLDLGAATMTVRDENLLGWPRDPDLLREQLVEYRALVAHLDEQVGRILQALGDEGFAADTLVVFTADHGLALGSHGLLGKQSLYEHSMRAPCIVAGPGAPVGERRDGLCYLLDLMPTIAAAADCRDLDGVDGRDLWPMLRGEADGRGELLLLYADTQRALRTAQHALIRLPRIDRSLLFDLVADPDQLHDLSQDPAQAAVLAELGTRLRAAQQAVEDDLPWSVEPLQPAEVDLAGRRWPPDRWQPAWIRAKYW